MSLLRTRWSAVGAAVAVTLGAGGIGLVSATFPSDATTFVPITPCRLFDTRPEFQVGDRGTPLEQATSTPSSRPATTATASASRRMPPQCR